MADTAGTVSVVIPAYNVGAHIGKCLASVLSQTRADLEAIVIDDGSTDGTAEVVEGYAADPRVKCIRQKNAGVAAARNAGLDAATGEFLAFVDGDDWIEETMHEKLHVAMRRAGADTAVCDYNLAYEDRTEERHSGIRDGTADVHDDAYGYFAKHCAGPRPNNYIWTRLYRTETVRRSGVRFESYKLGDDTLFNFKLLPHTRRVAFVSGGLYNYFQRPSSNVYTAAKRNNLAEVYADTFDALADYWEAMGFDEFLKVLPLHAFTRLRSVFFYSRLAGMREEEIVENVLSGFKGRAIARCLTGAAK
jgi:glycosyltransferase involved in cell wall biosynthesis